MKALYQRKYGNPLEVLSIGEVPKPGPKSNEVLIRVKASAINDYDWAVTTGKPQVYRVFFGLFRPKNPILGMEVAGIVESMGSEVSIFKEGDKVYGDISQYGLGSCAEYLTIDQRAIKLMPEKCSYTNAVSIPHAGLLALQGLRDLGKIKEGQNILVNGGGGGVGSIAVQIAKMYGCSVTGVDSEDKFEDMRAWGFDHLIDYRKEDFTKCGELFDIVFDCKTSYSALSYLKLLKPEGRYVTIGGKVGRFLEVLLLGVCLPLFSSKKLKMLALKSNEGLEELSDLMTQGKIRYAIDGPYHFKKGPELVQYFGEARHKGKVVMEIP